MLIELTRPTATPVMVAELAEALRLPSGFGADPERDARLGRLLDVAARVVEARAGRALLTRQAVVRRPRWDAGPALRLPLAPAARVLEVAVEDGAGGRAALDAGDWRFDPIAAPPAVTARAGRRLPPVPAEGFVEVRFEAGFGADWSDCPADLRLATVTLAAAAHDGLDLAGPPPASVAALLAPYRPVRL
jgi:uncharacterized phiE125 gp8 family phage protein